jgi:CP family cyanate transporter-like MFS transporter
VPVSSQWRLIALIALVGFQLRAVILGVPPVLPGLRDDLHLSFTAAGALVALPVFCLGAAAIPGAVLVNRFGPRLVVGASTLGLGVAACLRLIPPVPAALFVFSALLALCAAVAQPAMVATVRAWFPGSIQRAATVFTTALGLGGLGGAALSVHLLGLGGWRGTFLIWGGLALAAGLLWLMMTPGHGDASLAEPSGLGQLVRDPAVWHVAAIFGAQSLVFYGSSSWIPFELRAYGGGFTSITLLMLNVTFIPLAFVLVALRWPWARSRGFYVIAGILMTAGTAAFATGPSRLAPVWAAVLSIGAGMTFTGSSALPALFARSQGQTAGYAALVLTAGYAISFAGPFLGGVLLDRTQVLASPFWVMVTASAGLILLGATLPRRPSPGPRGESAPARKAQDAFGDDVALDLG